jgi:hypothetical protein
MKRIIKSIVLLKGQNGMKTMKSFLIALVVMVTAVVATINVVLNEKDSILSNLTLQNLDALATECPSPSNASELTNGCKSNDGVPYIDKDGNGIMIFSCSPGQDVTCIYGVSQVNNGVIEQGQVLSTYICRTIIII